LKKENEELKKKVLELELHQTTDEVQEEYKVNYIVHIYT